MEAAIRQCHSKRLDGTGHRIGRVHAATRTGPGTTVSHYFLALLLAPIAGEKFTVTLETPKRYRVFHPPNGRLGSYRRRPSGTDG